MSHIDDDKKEEKTNKDTPHVFQVSFHIFPFLTRECESNEQV